jgi:hypothetical protein
MGRIKSSVMIFCLAAILAMFLPATAPAEDVLLNARIQDVAIALDKNGKQYVRIIVNEERSLKGIAYEVGVPVLGFGGHAEKARSLKKGDTLKAVCDRRESQGRVTYFILKVVP